LPGGYELGIQPADFFFQLHQGAVVTDADGDIGRRCGYRNPGWPGINPGF
jgi:hypothetical protein